jgi:transposase
VFAIEREINGLTTQQRVDVRRAYRPLVIALEAWLRQQRGRVCKSCETGKAIDDSLKLWVALTRFLEDGRLCISNNAAERAASHWTFAAPTTAAGVPEPSMR